VLYTPGAVGRFGLSALVVVVAVSATAVATGRTTVPLRALGAARVAVGLSDPTAPPPRSVARAAILRVDPALDLPMAGAATDAREHTAAVLDEIAAQRAGNEAVAAAQAAERRAALAHAVARAAEQRAAAEKTVSRRLAAKRVAAKATAREADERKEADRQAAAARQADAQRAAAREATEKEEAEKAAAQKVADKRAAENEGVPLRCLPRGVLEQCTQVEHGGVPSTR